MKELSQQKVNAGRKGGLATFAKYGSDHFRNIGKRGARVFWSRYKLEPVGQSDFAIVNRETLLPIAFLSGKPFE